MEGVDHISEPPDGICCLLQRVIFFLKCPLFRELLCDKLVLVPVGSRKHMSRQRQDMDRPPRRGRHNVSGTLCRAMTGSYVPWHIYHDLKEVPRSVS